jgi:hypothetical protein
MRSSESPPGSIGSSRGALHLVCAARCGPRGSESFGFFFRLPITFFEQRNVIFSSIRVSKYGTELLVDRVDPPPPEQSLADLLLLEDILVDIDVSSKSQLIEEIGRHMERTHAMPHDSVAPSLKHREQIGSTGLGHSPRPHQGPRPNTRCVCPPEIADSIRFPGRPARGRRTCPAGPEESGRRTSQNPGRGNGDAFRPALP